MARIASVGVLYPGDLVLLLVSLAMAIMATTLILVLATSLKRRYLEYWAVGWSVQAVYLALLLAIMLGWAQFAGSWHALGALAALIFGLTLILGCRDFVGRPTLSWWWLLLFPVFAVPVVIAAFGLEDYFRATLSTEPSRQLSMVLIESIIQALATGVALVYLSRAAAVTYPTSRMGQRLFSIALLVSLLFDVHQLLLFGWSWQQSRLGFINYLVTASRFEMVIELLTAFGIIILTLDSVRVELEAMNRDLAAATTRLEKLAHHDAMTEALNRHAFYTLLEQNRPAAEAVACGAVVLLDVDRLKPINDALGHAAGDAVIRGVSKAIRSLIRSDDLLFRWGGDEFLVLLPNVTVAEAENRFSRLNDLLKETELPGSPQPRNLEVSYGIAEFASLTSLETAIGQADRRMFAAKERQRPHSE